MTKQGRTHNTPKEFLQKYKSPVDPAEKRMDTTEWHSQKRAAWAPWKLLLGSPPPGAAWLIRDKGI